jgi:aldehyde dehydrogenase (NAD+)
VREETFAPILYVMKFRDLDQAIAVHNDVPAGTFVVHLLTGRARTEAFLSASGSDCGIANVNIVRRARKSAVRSAARRTREAAANRVPTLEAYMRRQTNTINYSRELPLAQGIKFAI